MRLAGWSPRSYGGLHTWTFDHTQQPLGRIDGPPVYLDFHPDNQSVISVGADHEIRVWSLEHAGHWSAAGWCDGAIDQFVVAANGNYLVGYSDAGQLQMFRLDGSLDEVHVSHRYPGVRALAAATAQDVFVTAHIDRSIRLWHLTPQPTPTYLGKFPGAPIRTIAISARGNRIVAGRDDGTVQLWDTDTARPPTTFGAVGAPPIRSVCLDNGGDHALSTSLSGALRVWNLRSTQQLDLTYDARIGHATALTNDGRHAVAAVANGLACWNCQTGAEVTRASFSGMSGYCLSARTQDGRIRVATISRELGLTAWQIVLPAN